MHKFLIYNKFIIFLYMFRALLRSSSGGQIVLYSMSSLNPRTGQPRTERDDTRCRITQFDGLMMSTTVLETCTGI